MAWGPNRVHQRRDRGRGGTARGEAGARQRERICRRRPAAVSARIADASAGSCGGLSVEETNWAKHHVPIKDRGSESREFIFPTTTHRQYVCGTL
jgi:hypothetical protein